jgi:hypothetical protein
MARLAGGLLGAIAFALVLNSAQAEEVELQVEWSEALLPEHVSADLADPEGKMRWELEHLKAGARWVRTLSFTDGTSAIERLDVSLDKRAPEKRRLLFTDPHKRSAAQRWALPHKDDGLLDVAGSSIELHRSTGDKSERLWIETRRVGIGWIFLPSRPFEVVLQRALVHRWTPGKGYVPDTLVHRWVDPRAGIIADVWGPASKDGQERLFVEGARFVDNVIKGAVPFKLYVDAFDLPTFTRFVYGYDRGLGTLVSDLTPDNHLEIGDLLAASSWDFSGNVAANSDGEFVSTNVDINTQETCWADDCGFNVTAGGDLGQNKLGRDDRTDFITSELTLTNSAQQRETRVTDATIWLRAVQRDSGLDGQLSRLCFVDDGTPRTEAPLYRFPNEDAGGWFMQAGDSWASTPFACELNVFALQDCGENCGLFCPNYLGACADKTGTVFGSAVAEGPVTLPSGHTFNSLVINTTSDYCVDIFGSCSSFITQVRAVGYLWAVPHLGSITRIQSSNAAFTTTDWTQGAGRRGNRLQIRVVPAAVDQCGQCHR